MRIAAVIPAAGAGVRMGADRKKQYLLLGGVPILARTLGIFEQLDIIDEVIVAAPADDLDFIRADIVEAHGIFKVSKVVEGGVRRQDSVFIGLKAASQPCDLAVIHDGVRPLATLPLVTEAVEAAWRFGGSVVCAKAFDTIKQADDDGFVKWTPERRTMFRAQTPQVFRYDMILRAYERAAADGFEATDDSQLVERLGEKVKIVVGDEENIKITTPKDLAVAETILKKRGEW